MFKGEGGGVSGSMQEISIIEYYSGVPKAEKQTHALNVISIVALFLLLTDTASLAVHIFSQRSLGGV
jgi:hypothetical protein